MVEDTLDDALDDDELEDDAQEEVDKVLFELTAGMYTNYVSTSASMYDYPSFIFVCTPLNSTVVQLIDAHLVKQQLSSAISIHPKHEINLQI